jgi:hypothetical protein
MPRKPQIVVYTGNSFAALAESDSDVEIPVQSEETVVEVKKSPPFRVWTIDEADIRFKNDTNIFSSPFSRKKNWARPRFKEDDEGWVSIQVGQPDQSGPSEIPEIPEIPPTSSEDTPSQGQGQSFPSMLTRGDQEIAMVWAEKVKKSLEKAEKSRSEFKRGKTPDVGTKLSFFRKTE